MRKNMAQRVANTEDEQNLKNALDGLKDGTFVHVRQAARATGASKTTIFRHMNGGKSKREVQQHRQQLSPDEEQTLAKWVLRLSSTGHPVHHSFLRELAEEIRKSLITDSVTPLPTLGKNWTSRFLARNPFLQSKVAKSIEAARKEVTEAQIKSWFSEFKRIVDEYNVLPENIYNMDETGSHSQLNKILTMLGFNIGIRGRNAYVICSAMEKKVYQSEPGRTEWVTVVEYICGDGTAIKPLVIFKGESIQTSWIPEEMDKDWSWSYNTKGWTCDAISEDWIQIDFESATAAKANGATRFLIVDGHGSHVTAPFIRFCMDHNIEVLLLPPHSSHLTQPLDVAIFSPLKSKMSGELDKILRYGYSNIKKFEWANCYRIARPHAMKASNIQSAWNGAGLIPFNPQKIIRHLKAGLAEQETQQLISQNATPLTLMQTPPHARKFNLIPDTPSKVDRLNVRSAAEALAHNVQAGIFDTPTKEYILKLSALNIQYQTLHTVHEHHLNSITEINKQRRVMEHGKRVVLKDQTVITTEAIYQQLKACEEATEKKRGLKGCTKRKSGLRATVDSINNRQRQEEGKDVVLLDEIEVMIA